MGVWVYGIYINGKEGIGLWYKIMYVIILWQTSIL